MWYSSYSDSQPPPLRKISRQNFFFGSEVSSSARDSWHKIKRNTQMLYFSRTLNIFTFPRQHEGKQYGLPSSVGKKRETNKKKTWVKNIERTDHFVIINMFLSSIAVKNTVLHETSHCIPHAHQTPNRIYLRMTWILTAVQEVLQVPIWNRCDLPSTKRKNTEKTTIERTLSSDQPTVIVAIWGRASNAGTPGRLTCA